MAALLGYARVSTGEQELALQHDALTAAGCLRIFSDTASGSLDERVELARLLDHLREGDTLVVWRLDRLGRSLRHLIDTVTALADRGVGFRSLQESIDTTTPGGRLIFHVFAALAEFERDLIRERTHAGLAAARARGRKGGRPTVMTPAKLDVAREMYASRQHTIAAIAAVVGVSRATLYRALTADPVAASSPPTPPATASAHEARDDRCAAADRCTPRRARRLRPRRSRGWPRRDGGVWRVRASCQARRPRGRASVRGAGLKLVIVRPLGEVLQVHDVAHRAARSGVRLSAGSCSDVPHGARCVREAPDCGQSGQRHGD